MTDDKTLPPGEPVNDTLPPPADPETEVEVLPPALPAIPRGWARFALDRAVTHTQRSIDKLAEDLRALVALADGYARALDAATE